MRLMQWITVLAVGVMAFACTKPAESPAPAKPPANAPANASSADKPKANAKVPAASPFGEEPVAAAPPAPAPAGPAAKAVDKQLTLTYFTIPG